MPFVTAEDLQAYTEDWPPYNYIAGNELKGISTEILHASCELEKINCAIQMVPWLRAYKTVQETPNTLIYSIARNPQREKDFAWVGPILPRTTWIYGKAGMQANIHNFKDLASARIGMIRGEVSIDDLLAAGVPQSSILVLNSNTDVMRMMKLGKVDVLVNTEIGMAINLQNFSVPSESFTKLIKLSDGGSLYFALNPQSDPVLIERLQTSIDRLRREGKIDAIVRSYTKEKN
ncbi:MAG: transporter substrate-binding domain-containing protein [Pseudomonadota bacterium]